jgi:uncharacterized membrane protein
MVKVSSFQKLIAVFIAFIITMLVCRFVYAGSIRYIFLLWNLFLAWIPFQLSILLTSKKYISQWASYFLLAAWLLFFPNALYIITDLVHLEEPENDAPIWFDAILLFTSSIVGLILAFASLFKVEVFLQRKLKSAIVNRLIIGCLFVGSFGVYLGRFLRWNSWDIIAHPLNLLTQIIAPFILPFQHYRTWGVTVLLTCLFSLLYFTIKKLPGFLKEPGNTFIA